MRKPGKIVTLIFNAAIFIALEIAALGMLRSSKAQDFFVSKGAHAFMAKVWGSTQAVKYYFSLKQANEELAAQNFALNQELQAWMQYAEEATRDSLTRSFEDIAGFHYMSASIVKISRNKQHNYLILGQGSEDGVVPRSGIITPQGVIGIVDAVGKHYSYAISFMNTDFSLSARLGREGAVGPLVWDGKSSGGAILKEIPLQYRFEPGDTVYTSGFSSIFPADIPIGLTGSSRIVNGATYEINVSLLQNVGAARYVTLVNNVGRQEIESLETEAEP
ncbi:MAG: rod shape-determining protein MreC [Bacteroidales bacterium]|nr:rod shape-determining protein MreC [Bacteroidales bacterium]